MWSSIRFPSQTFFVSNRSEKKPLLYFQGGGTKTRKFADLRKEERDKDRITYYSAILGVPEALRPSSLSKNDIKEAFVGNRHASDDELKKQIRSTLKRQGRLKGENRITNDELNYLYELFLETPPRRLLPLSSKQVEPWAQLTKVPAPRESLANKPNNCSKN